MPWKGILGIDITELWLQPPLEAMELIWLMALSTGTLKIIISLKLFWRSFDKFRFSMSFLYLHLLNMSVLFDSSGCYGPDVNLEKLKDFHRRRLQVLVKASPDLLAFETIPNKLEAQVRSSSISAFWSFTCSKLFS